MEGVYDGFVSRHLNRRVSRPIARALTHTPLTPNQVSVISLGVALGSFLSFVFGYYIAGALLAQASSIVDGVDGDLARAKKMTSAFGGFFDAILDRYADAVILLGLTIWAADGAGDDLQVYVWTVGFLAMAASGAAYLVRRNLAWDHWAQAAAEVGWLCSGLTLLTGSLWAHSAWGTWWTWDPRLTTAFVLWSIYSGCLIVRAGVEDPHELGLLA